MNIKKIDQNKIGFFGYIIAFIANADTEVLKKHSYVRRDIVNLALLMTGMTILVFALQYMALSSYTGDKEFGIIAACLSAGIILMLDRIVVGGDYETEGEILYLKETHGDKKEILKLKLKRALGMALRVSIGVTIAYAAVTLSMPKILSFEIEGHFDKKELDQNPEANQQLQTSYDEHIQLISEKRAVLKDLEDELSSSHAQQEIMSRTLLADIHQLQDARSEAESNKLFAKDCANAELSGRITTGCNSSGKTGDGLNYSYWIKQAKLHEDQAKNYLALIKEKQQQIKQSPEMSVQVVINQRMTKVLQEIGELESVIKDKLENAKNYQVLAGARQPVIRQGPVAMNDATNIVRNAASDYTRHTLLLLKCWVMLLELCVFVARFTGCGKDYALAQYKEKLLRARHDDDDSSLPPLSAVA